MRGKGWKGSANSFVTRWRRTHYENSMIDAFVRSRSHASTARSAIARCRRSWIGALSDTQDEVRALVAVSRH